MSHLAALSARIPGLRLPEPAGGWTPHQAIKLASALGASLVLLAVAAAGSAESVGLVLLSVFAVSGLFMLYGLLAGYVRIDLTATTADVERLAAAAAPQALEVVALTGAARYANDAADHLRGGRYPSLELLIAAEADRADAAYRLAATAARGETAVEDVYLPRRGQSCGPQWLRVSVAPVPAPLSAPDAEPMVLWTATDVTADRAALVRAEQTAAAALAPFTDLPVGVCTVAADGSLRFVNDTLRRLLGSDAIRSLDDITGEAGALRLRSALRAPADRSLATVAVDLLREDGVALPATVHLQPQANGARSLIVVPTQPGTAREFTGVEGAMQRLFDSAPFGIATIDHEGRIVSANAAFARLVPETPGAANGIVHRLTQQAPAEQRTTVEATVLRALSGRIATDPVDIIGGGDATAVRRITVNPLTVGLDPRDAAIVFVADASEQKALEQRFAQSEKMEAIGTFVAGIAHDFNNVLGGIIGSSEHLLHLQREGDRGHSEVRQIRDTAMRAADMVKQLMAFTRQQTLSPQILNMNEEVQEMSRMLNTFLEGRISVALELGRDLWSAKADRTQINRVLVNLARNAKDAMPKGGKLTIRTRNITERASRSLKGEGMPSGEYVLIEVEDTGSGMPPEVLAKLFQPFFTTKEVGKGTGLGLASVYGIIKQTGGFIYPESAVGKGTTFRIFLPRTIPTEAEEKARAEAAAAERAKRERPRDLTGTGRILLVEDEDFLRAVTARQLRRLGYEVLEAITGAEALEVMEAEDGKVDLVVSDVIMPEMDGPTMYREMLKSYPGMKVIFVSGYPSDAFDKGLEPSTTFTFVQKPYPGEVLAGKVKEALAA